MSEKQPHKIGIPEPITPYQILAAAGESIQKSMPPTMRAVTDLQKVTAAQKSQIDTVLKIQTAALQEATFAIEIKKTLNIRDIGPTVEMLNRYIKQIDNTMEPMIISRFISKNAQDWLKSRSISYADATGNFMLSSPAIDMYWSDRGADTDPWRKPGRPRVSLYGNAPARIVRALIDTKPPMSVPELIKRAKSSSGAAYRTLEFLENEDLVTRNKKLIEEVNWPKIIERWSDAYSFQKNNSVIGFLEPRGLTNVLKKLEKISNSEYAITGSLAAQRYAPYAEPRQAMIYAKYPIELAERLGLRAVDTGANVLIAATAFDVVFERTIRDGGLNYVAISQIAVDLLNGPGRNPVEGQELVEWMVKNENVWRK